MAKRRPGRPKDPLAKSEKILIRVQPRLKRDLEKLASANHRKLATFCRELLEDLSKV